jgi:hypothetical protein
MVARAIAAAIGLALALWAPVEAGRLGASDVTGVAMAKGCKGGPSDWVAGFFAPDDALSGVFWCRVSGDEFDRRSLIVVIDRHVPRRIACPDVIRSINRPLGLRVLHEVEVPLSWFSHPTSGTKSRPGSGLVRGPVIDTGDDGAGEQWICYKSVWRVRVYH